MSCRSSSFILVMLTSVIFSVGCGFDRAIIPGGSENEPDNPTVKNDTSPEGDSGGSEISDQPDSSKKRTGFASMAHEFVKCIFRGTNREHTCFADDERGGCSGVGACSTYIEGFEGEKITWKSTCGGYAYTVIDGQEEYAEFDCLDSNIVQPPQPSPSKEPIFEEVTCNFVGSNSLQECVSSFGASCTGAFSCVVKVTGDYGAEIKWKSTCGGYATTVLDGKNESATFSCSSSTPAPPEIAEAVTCVFANSKQEQSCYSSTGLVCKGVGFCTLKVQGKYGEPVEWKSSCGGYASTTIDGKDEKISFGCQDPSNPPQPTPQSAEEVKCVFYNSKTVQECYSSTGVGCKGIDACVVKVEGNASEKVTWKSSCGGYAYTVIDGKNEYAEFKCASPSISEYVVCVFLNTKAEQKCYSSNGFGCSGYGACIASVEGPPGEKVTWKSSCGGYAYTVVDGAPEYALFDCGSSKSQPSL